MNTQIDWKRVADKCAGLYDQMVIDRNHWRKVADNLYEALRYQGCECQSKCKCGVSAALSFYEEASGG